MALSDPIDILLAHDVWATDALLGACAELSEEEFGRSFEIGPGSLHDAVRHMLGAKRGWTDMLRGEMMPGGTPRARLESEGEKTAAAFAELHATVAAEFEAAVRTGSLEDVISGERGGNMYSFTRGAILTHVTTHGMHHRAQCMNMLRRLGVDPVPPSSVMEWTMMADSVD